LSIYFLNSCAVDKSETSTTGFLPVLGNFAVPITAKLKKYFWAKINWRKFHSIYLLFNNLQVCNWWCTTTPQFLVCADKAIYSSRTYFSRTRTIVVKHGTFGCTVKPHDIYMVLGNNYILNIHLILHLGCIEEVTIIFKKIP
jgi:hypothetical protein